MEHVLNPQSEDKPRGRVSWSKECELVKNLFKKETDEEEQVLNLGSLPSIDSNFQGLVGKNKKYFKKNMPEDEFQWLNVPNTKSLRSQAFATEESSTKIILEDRQMEDDLFLTESELKDLLSDQEIIISACPKSYQLAKYSDDDEEPKERRFLKKKKEKKEIENTEDLKDDLQKKDDDFLIESEQKDLVSDQEIGAATLSKTYKLESDSDEEDSLEQFIAMWKARKISTSQYQNCEEEPTGKRFLKKVKEERKDIESEKSRLEDDYVKEPQSQHDEYRDDFESYDSLDEDGSFKSQTTEPNLKDDEVNSLSELSIEEDEDDFRRYASLEEDKPFKCHSTEPNLEDRTQFQGLSFSQNLPSDTEDLKDDLQKKDDDFLIESEQKDLVLTKRSNHEEEPTGKQFLKKVKEERKDIEKPYSQHEECEGDLDCYDSLDEDDPILKDDLESISEPFDKEYEEESHSFISDTDSDISLSFKLWRQAEEIKAEEARLKKQHREDLKKLRENLKADQQRQEIHFVQEHEAALKDISEKENRLKAANEERLENLRQSCWLRGERRKKGLRRNRRQEEKLREESNSTLENLRAKLQQEQEKDIEKLKTENEERLETLRQSLLAKNKEEEASLNEEYEQKLEELRETMKADRLKQEIKIRQMESQLKAENEERLKTLRQSLLAKNKEEEARLKEESEQKLEEFRETLKADRLKQEIKIRQEESQLSQEISQDVQKRQEEKLREENDATLADLKVKLQEQQQKDIKKLKMRNMQKLERLKVELEEELAAEKDKLQKHKDKCLESAKHDIEEEKKALMKAKFLERLNLYRKEMANKFKEAREELEKEQEKNLEQLREDHKKEMRRRGGDSKTRNKSSLRR
ncbi:hypothetical protein WMY93_017525 [Mugilogobius chulae]|uniref:Uncharacterized protein n=1 Tax=Mugilogobius chulae TaxID=88201 RepID=A0AAW0NPN2_9GOBI